jgi:dTDP-4-amino-4,6-dideoxygalactose transaminase
MDTSEKGIHEGILEGKPAILGGSPAFSKLIPIVRPNIDRYAAEITPNIDAVLKSNMVTSVDLKLKEFEQGVERTLGVTHAVAVSTCTNAMILSLQALGLHGQEIITPSFTFSATSHALYWNNCQIRFADIDPETFTISIASIKENLTPKTKAILAVHMYGNPCDIDAINALAKEKGLKVIYDAAHAFGSSYHGRKIGSFGDAECFSLSPTKLLTTVEGGLVTTKNPELVKAIKLDRNYGNYPDFTCDRPGLNARMSEVNAVIGLAQLSDVDLFVAHRNEYAERFTKNLSTLPGLTFQKIRDGCVATRKDFGFVVDPAAFGLSRDELAEALKKENVMTKFYFYPPMHQITPYKNIAHKSLVHTERISKNVICLPIFNFMDDHMIDTMCNAVIRIRNHAQDIKKKIHQEKGTNHD